MERMTRTDVEAAYALLRAQLEAIRDQIDDILEELEATDGQVAGESTGSPGVAS